jgi:excisionase family DNA binding protein
MAEVVTVRAAAQMLGVHENTIRNWIASGELPYEERGARMRRASFGGRQT